MNAHMLCRLDFESPFEMGPVIDANVEAGPHQAAVGVFLPDLPDIAKLHMRGRLSGIEQPLVLPLDERLLAQAFRRHPARRHHHMGMMISDVAILARPMNGEVDGRTIAI